MTVREAHGRWTDSLCSVRETEPAPRPRIALLGLAALTLCSAGCTDWSFSLEDCGQTCGDGPLYLFDTLEFAIEDETGLDGFDLDGITDDCEVPDGTSPAGLGGIDNRFGDLWEVLPDTVATVIPTAINTSIQSGALMVVMEVVRPGESDDEPAALVFREGSGDVLVGTDSRPLDGQTIDLAPGDNLLGMSDQAAIVDGQIEATEVDILFRLEYLDTEIELFVVRGIAEMTEDEDGSLNMKLGGMVPLAAVMDLVNGLGGDGDANIRAALEALIPLMVDVRTTPEGACDGISGVFLGHAVPVYLFSP